jgi:hypothetical protein
MGEGMAYFCKHKSAGELRTATWMGGGHSIKESWTLEQWVLPLVLGMYVAGS